MEDDWRAPAAPGAARHEHLVAVRRAVHGRGPHDEPARHGGRTLGRRAGPGEAGEACEQEHGGSLHPLRCFSFSGWPPTATTRSRPPAFAWYIAASALAISVSGVSPCAGHSATPMESDIRPSPKVSPATRARIRSATRAAVVTVVSSSTTRNSSPP